MTARECTTTSGTYSPSVTGPCTHCVRTARQMAGSLPVSKCTISSQFWWTSQGCTTGTTLLQSARHVTLRDTRKGKAEIFFLRQNGFFNRPSRLNSDLAFFCKPATIHPARMTCQNDSVNLAVPYCQCQTGMPDCQSLLRIKLRFSN